MTFKNRNTKPVIALIYILISFIFVITSSTSFSQNKIQTLKIQKVYFEYYFYRPGDNFNIHWIIDNKGYVRINSNTNSYFHIDSININDFKNLFDKKIHKVDINELEHYVSLIPEFLGGKIICEDSIIKSDYGENGYNCFIHDQLICIIKNTERENCYNEKVAKNKLVIWLEAAKNEVFQKIEKRNYFRK